MRAHFLRASMTLEMTFSAISLCPYERFPMRGVFQFTAPLPLGKFLWKSSTQTRIHLQFATNCRNATLVYRPNKYHTAAASLLAMNPEICFYLPCCNGCLRDALTVRWWYAVMRTIQVNLPNHFWTMSRCNILSVLENLHEFCKSE